MHTGEGHALKVTGSNYLCCHCPFLRRLFKFQGEGIVLSHLDPVSNFTFFAYRNTLTSYICVYIHPRVHTPAFCLELMELPLGPAFLIPGNWIKHPGAKPAAVGVKTRRGKGDREGCRT